MNEMLINFSDSAYDIASEQGIELCLEILEFMRKELKKYQEEMCEVYGAKEDYRGFCSGVMLIRRDFLDLTRDKWQQYINKFETKGERDQGVYNQLIVDLGGKYNELDEKWGAWYRTGTYIEHLGGPFRKFNFDEDKFTRKHNISMPKENSLLNFF